MSHKVPGQFLIEFYSRNLQPVSLRLLFFQSCFRPTGWDLQSPRAWRLGRLSLPYKLKYTNIRNINFVNNYLEFRQINYGTKSDMGGNFFQTFFFAIFFCLFTCFVLLVCFFILLCFCYCPFFFHFWISYTTWPDSEGWSTTLKLKSDGVTFYSNSAFGIPE